MRTTIAILLALMTSSTPSWAEEVGNIILPEESKVFKQVMGPVSFADAYGNRETGFHGTFGRFPAGFETPVHTHSHAYRAVVLKGKMTNPFDGEDMAPILAPGSYWSVAANAPHSTACVSKEPCEFFMFGTKSFDFLPVE